jgi:hypothetical protein
MRKQLHRFVVGAFSSILMFLSFVVLFGFGEAELATLLIIASMCSAIAGKMHEPD